MSGERERLPNRRRNATETIVWAGTRVHVCAGFTDDGRITEAFVRCGKAGSERDELIDDAAVILSRLLQFGDSLTLIAKGLGCRPDAEPASLIGAVVNRLLLMEEVGP
jgi:hypothetical protein